MFTASAYFETALNHLNKTNLFIILKKKNSPKIHKIKKNKSKIENSEMKSQETKLEYQIAI
jgi:hypothetical protein